MLMNLNNFQFKSCQSAWKYVPVTSIALIFSLLLLCVLYPVSADNVNEGMDLYNSGEYDKSIDWFENALKTTQGNDRATLLNNIGVSYLALGQPEDAEENFKKALEVNSSYYNALINLGVLYGNAGKYDEAIEYYDKAIKLIPPSDAAIVYIKKGSLLTLTGKYDDALSAFKQAEPNAKKTDQLALYTGLGVIYYINKDSGAAEEAFNRAIESDPSNATIPYYNLGMVKINEKDYVDAKKALEKAVSISPSGMERVNQLIAKLDKLIANSTSFKI